MRAVLLIVFAACSSAEHPRTVSPALPAPMSASVSASAPIPDPPPPALRLPGDVKPVQYALDLTIVPAQPTATGRVHISAEVVRPARVVWLNATGLAIDHAELDGTPAPLITRPRPMLCAWRRPRAVPQHIGAHGAVPSDHGGCRSRATRLLDRR